MKAEEKEKYMDQITVKAETLIEALPYIRDFNNKRVVVKYGGSAMSEIIGIKSFSSKVSRISVLTWAISPTYRCAFEISRDAADYRTWGWKGNQPVD